jgi:PAS domain S-box-containing protein
MSSDLVPPVVARWLLELAASTSEQSIIFLSKDGTILHWLGASERTFGYTAEEATGMSLDRLFTPEDVMRGLAAHERALALSTGRAEDDRWHVRKNGSTFWGSGVMEPVRDDRGTVVALCKALRDRTDVRAQVESFQNRLRQAEEANARLKELLSSSAHELRNQVGPMMNSLALLARSTDPAVQQNGLAVLRRNLQLMSTLLNDLADFGESGTGRLAIQLREVELQAVLAQVAASYSAALQGRRQELKVTVPEQPIVIQADPERLEQVLSNLLSNSSKYTPEGGWIAMSATIEADMAVIRVEDNGIGISGEMLPHIFELFTREQPRHGPKGLGVGLNVAKQLVDAHGGLIEARSPGAGEGSIFTIRLPMWRPGE